jgi:hypothetical protein
MTAARRGIATIGPAAAVALALAACGGGVKNSSATTRSTSGTTRTIAGGQASSGTSTVTDSGTTSTTTESTSTSVLAQQTVKAPDSKDGTVDIAVLGLAVQGQLATLTVRFTPHFPSAAPDDSISLYDMSDNAMSQDEVSLVDPVGLKRYLVLQDANRSWLGADEDGTRAVNNSSVSAQWTFAAPPPSVTKIDVDLGPFPPFNDVPISR